MWCSYAKFFVKEIPPIVAEAYPYAIAEDSIYHPTDFLMNPLPAFEVTEIREQEKGDPALAVKLDKALENAYTDSGFRVVRVNKDPVASRSRANEDLERAIRISFALTTNTILPQCGLPLLPS